MRSFPLISNKLKLAYDRVRSQAPYYDATALLLVGKQMSWYVANLPRNMDFRRVGFKVFSQWDEDGIIQYLISKIPIKNKTFIEFGVENYEESNTRFLLVNDHWQGLVMDAREADIRYIQRHRMYWQYDLRAQCTWITRENIDALLRKSGFSEDLGLLSIDIDGNDYWIWEAIRSVKPRILIIEYNSVLGLEPIVVPYRQDFNRTAAHHSSLYYGASLGALHQLARKNGYILLGSNVWGHNAFFIREDVASGFLGLEPSEAYVFSKFRESRDRFGKLTYVRGEDRIKLIEHLPVRNVAAERDGSIKDFWKAP